MGKLERFMVDAKFNKIPYTYIQMYTHMYMYSRIYVHVHIHCTYSLYMYEDN